MAVTFWILSLCSVVPETVSLLNDGDSQGFISSNTHGRTRWASSPAPIAPGLRRHCHPNTRRWSRCHRSAESTQAWEARSGLPVISQHQQQSVYKLWTQCLSALYVTQGKATSGNYLEQLGSTLENEGPHNSHQSHAQPPAFSSFHKFCTSSCQLTVNDSEAYELHQLNY